MSAQLEASKFATSGRYPRWRTCAARGEQQSVKLRENFKEGEIYSVRYDAVNAMLLNEFQREHRTVQDLKNEVAALTATVKEQAAQIQRVTAQLELTNLRRKRF